jgi:hypothetical protein
MIRGSLLRFAIPLVVASPAFADPAGGDGCARSLSPAALEVYRAAAPDLRPDSDLRALLRAKVMPLVMTGEMNTSTARSAAIGASVCLRSLQQTGFVAQGGPGTGAPAQTVGVSETLGSTPMDRTASAD